MEPHKVPGRPGVTKATAAASKRWFLVIGEREVGPMDLSEVEQHWRKREINPQSLAWHPGISDWQPISDLPPLAQLLMTPQEASGWHPAAGAGLQALAQQEMDLKPEPASSKGQDGEPLPSLPKLELFADPSFEEPAAPTQTTVQSWRAGPSDGRRRYWAVASAATALAILLAAAWILPDRLRGEPPKSGRNLAGSPALAPPRLVPPLPVDQAAQMSSTSGVDAPVVEETAQAATQSASQASATLPPDAGATIPPSVPEEKGLSEQPPAPVEVHKAPASASRLQRRPEPKPAPTARANRPKSEALDRPKSAAPNRPKTEASERRKSETREGSAPPAKLTREEVWEQTRAQAKSLAPCLKRARERGEVPAGSLRLVLQWTISAEGSVPEAKLVAPTELLSTELGICIADRMKTWHFRASPEPTTVRNFPLPVTLP